MGAITEVPLIEMNAVTTELVARQVAETYCSQHDVDQVIVDYTSVEGDRLRLHLKPRCYSLMFMELADG